MFLLTQTMWPLQPYKHCQLKFRDRFFFWLRD